MSKWAERQRAFWNRLYDLESRPLLSSQAVRRICWWWLVGCPVAFLVIAVDTRHASSADEAIPFHFIPLLFVSIVLMPVVISRGRKADVDQSIRRVRLRMGLAILPMIVLCWVVDGVLGWQGRAQFGIDGVAVLLALCLWLMWMWRIRRMAWRRAGEACQP